MIRVCLNINVYKNRPLKYPKNTFRLRNKCENLLRNLIGLSFNGIEVTAGNEEGKVDITVFSVVGSQRVSGEII